MRSLVIAAALLACACTQDSETPAAAASAEPSLAPVTLPVADAAGNRMEALEQIGEGGLYCLGAQEWCVDVGEGNTISVQSAGGSPIELPARGELWPNAIRVGADGALFGVIAKDEQMYSGGGGQVQRVTFYEVAGGEAREAATLPLGAESTIRACFNEADETQRAGACHDMYNFVTRISLDESVAHGAPHIVLETAAGSFPGRVTRGADSLEAAPLQASDLVWARDETCSYRRVFTRGPDGVYAPDQPLPACSDYLEP